MTGQLSYEDATPFTRWFNFNPVSMQLRWMYHVWGGCGTLYKRVFWLAYLRHLPLVTPREFLRWCWMVTGGGVYRHWILRPLQVLRHLTG